MSNECRILLVEDNPGDAALMQKALRESNGHSFAVETAEDLEEALGRLRTREFDAVLLDLSLPDSHGLETFIAAYKAAPETAIVVLTGLADEAMAMRTVHEGAQDYLVKAELDPRLLVRAIRYAMERKGAALERERLLRSEQEKSEQLTLAVREAHHRIKNNLQAISDLLYLELSSGAGASAEEALRESMERVQAIALVHDLLSQHEDVQTVDTRAVIEHLVPMVLRSSGRPPDSIALYFDVPSLRFSSKRATTLALIVNELVSNAAKHAFRDGRDGELSISMRQESEDLVLRIQDNGPGLPEGFSFETHSHVGLDVVRVMAERDLDGHLSLTDVPGGGVRAEVGFRW